MLFRALFLWPIKVLTISPFFFSILKNLTISPFSCSLTDKNLALFLEKGDLHISSSRYFFKKGRSSSSTLWNLILFPFLSFSLSLTLFLPFLHSFILFEIFHYLASPVSPAFRLYSHLSLTIMIAAAGALLGLYAFFLVLPIILIAYGVRNCPLRL